MEQQLTFSQFEYANKTRTTRKEKFLAEMNVAMPWQWMCDIIQPYYFEKGNGRPPTPLLTMLKMHMLSHWYNISDEILEDTVHDSMAFKNFIGEHVPDATTLCKFRKLLEKNKLNKKVFDDQVKLLKENGIICQHGTINDATILHASASHKNKDKKINPEFSSVKKGNQWHFGMKSHVGVDEDSGLVHSAVSTIAKTHDAVVAGECLHGNEKRVRGDAAFLNIENRPNVCEKLQDGSGKFEEVKIKENGKTKVKLVPVKRNVEFIFNKRKSQIKTAEDKEQEYQKSKVRAKVEWIFLILKHIFGFRKVRLRTLAANDERLYMYYTLVNIYKLSKLGMTQNSTCSAQLKAA